jgi:hypothetical protein
MINPLSKFAFKFNLRRYTKAAKTALGEAHKQHGMAEAKLKKTQAATKARPARYCSPYHTMPFDSKCEGSTCVG